MRHFLQSLLGAVLVFAWLFTGSAFAGNTFNDLVLIKSELERQHGIRELECFPFLENIGFEADQIRLVDRCLGAVQTLRSALQNVPEHDVEIVGISHRFIRTGGFQNVLVRWDATQDEMERFLRHRISNEERTTLLDTVRQLKHSISNTTGTVPLFCSQKISNEECLRGYESLASGLADQSARTLEWREIMITDSRGATKDPFVLALKFDDSPAAMRQEVLNSDPNKNWDGDRKMYERIYDRYGQAFEEKLQLTNFFCATHLTAEECEQGASSLFSLVDKPVLRNQLWGKVVINRYNSLLINDHDLELRFDLPPGDMLRVLSRRPPRDELEQTVVRAEKLEARVKNNGTRLRVICDPVGLGSRPCVNSFENFIEFVKAHRGRTAQRPWTELMFVDGHKLSRVNFALNSKVRNSYIYVDANSTPEEMTGFLMLFMEPHTSL